MLREEQHLSDAFAANRWFLNFVLEQLFCSKLYKKISFSENQHCPATLNLCLTELKKQFDFSPGVSDVSKHLVLAKGEEGGGREQTFTCLFLPLSDWQLFDDVFLTCSHMPCTLQTPAGTEICSQSFA